MQKQTVYFEDLGVMDYQQAWDYQEKLLQENVTIKSIARDLVLAESSIQKEIYNSETTNHKLQTTNYLLFVEHPAVYTLGKSGNIKNVLLSEKQLLEKNIAFFHTNRGGDITYHGPGQVVGYPILDLEKFGTDIGKYLRNIEEVIILTLAEYGIKAERSKGETGVWIEPANTLKARKICAIGVRCSRWITMHGFALNVNTDLDNFNHIIPCGIQNKQVTSLQRECCKVIDIEEVKTKLKENFKIVFNVEIA